MTNFPQEILTRLQTVLPKRDEFIPLHVPVFDQRESKYVQACIESNYVSSVGDYGQKFEDMLREYTGVKEVVLCVNGTAALHLALHLHGVGPGDEVLIPSFSFVATANAVRQCGAEPHFVDIEDEFLGLDIGKLEAYLQEISSPGTGGAGPTFPVNKRTGKPMKAVIPMHTFGHPVDMDELNFLAEKWGLLVIEDAAESLGSKYKGVHTGNHSACAAVSFNGNKIITTGGGGAFLTNNTKLATRARHISTTAKQPHPWHYRHDERGFNYRMPALNSALGCGQLEKLNHFLNLKRMLAEKYQIMFSEMEGIRFLSEPDFAESNYWLNTLILDDSSGECLEQVLTITNQAGIMTRPAWTPLHLLPMYDTCQAMDLSVSENMAKRVFNIPSTPNLVDDYAPLP